jgi:hypothetical protein
VYGRPPSWEEKERKWQAEKRKREEIEMQREQQRGHEAERQKVQEGVHAYEEDKRARLQAAKKRGKDVAYKRNRRDWKHFKARQAAKQRRQQQRLEEAAATKAAAAKPKPKSKKEPVAFKMGAVAKGKLTKAIMHITTNMMFEGAQVRRCTIYI